MFIITVRSGFWVKVGQHLSSRADVLPAEWIAELSKLQVGHVPSFIS
jgi:predicted unusual protein kinase regulating ubiquinone biosynthesis (AarF/ABC1/UbiB family)